MSLLNNKKGFSVIELLIYIAILGMFLAVVMSSMISITKSYATIKSARSIHASAISSYERLANEIRGAKRVELGSSVLNLHPGVLTIVRDTAGGESISVFNIENNLLTISVDGNKEGTLTKDDSTITNLVFRYFNGTNGGAIKIEMTIQSTHGNATQTESFSDTFTLRGAY